MTNSTFNCTAGTPVDGSVQTSALADNVVTAVCSRPPRDGDGDGDGEPDEPGDLDPVSDVVVVLPVNGTEGGGDDDDDDAGGGGGRGNDGRGDAAAAAGDICDDGNCVNATLEVDGPAVGNGTCRTGFFAELFASNEMCQGGCCEEGRCACREGFVGARCEVELRCGAVDYLSPRAGWNLEACATVQLPEREGALLCRCRSLGFIAVLAHRLRPASSITESLGDGWEAQLRDELAVAWPLWLLLPLFVYGLLVSAAFSRDLSELYTVAAPQWARPPTAAPSATRTNGTATDTVAPPPPPPSALAAEGKDLASPRGAEDDEGDVGFPLWRQLEYTARTRHTLWRLFHVVPDFTPYTRLQLAHLLLMDVVMATLAVMTFLQTQQCSRLATLSSGAISTFVSALPGLLGRLAFKHSRAPRSKRAGRRHKRDLEQLFALGALPRSRRTGGGRGGGGRGGAATSAPMMMLPNGKEVAATAARCVARARLVSRRLSSTLTASSSRGSSTCGGGSSCGSSSRTLSRRSRFSKLGGGGTGDQNSSGDSLGEPSGKSPGTRTSAGGGVAASRPATCGAHRYSAQLGEAGEKAAAAAAGTPQLIGGLPPPRPSRPKVGFDFRSSGNRGCDANGGGGGGGGGVVELRPTQLLVRPDEYSLGFRLTGGSTGCCVPVEHVAASLWRPKLRVSYAADALPPGRQKGALCGSDVYDSSSAAAHDGAANGVSECALAKSGAGSAPPPALDDFRQMSTPKLARLHLLRRGAGAGAPRAGLRARPAAPLTRGGFRWPRAAAWAYSVAALLIGWLGVCALVLVALPTHTVASGLSTGEWWRQVFGATFFGLLNAYVVLDTIKVLALVFTGPFFILKLPEGKIRAIVKKGLRPIHKPLAAIL